MPQIPLPPSPAPPHLSLCLGPQPPTKQGPEPRCTGIPPLHTQTLTPWAHSPERPPPHGHGHIGVSWPHPGNLSFLGSSRRQLSQARLMKISVLDDSVRTPVPASHFSWSVGPRYWMTTKCGVWFRAMEEKDSKARRSQLVALWELACDQGMAIFLLTQP